MKWNLKTPYAFTPAGYVIYFCVPAVVMAIMLTRHNPDAWLAATGPFDLGSHASNFALSMLLVFFTGAISMLQKTDWKYILAWAAIMIAANFVVELLVPVLNVKDMADAVYGIAGTAIALVLLYAMQKFGLRPRSGVA